MTRRETGFLLIGLGVGLILSVVLAIEFFINFHHMFIIGIKWQSASLSAVPFLLIMIGLLLIYRGKKYQQL